MSLSAIWGLVQTALELGLTCSLTVLALFLSYSMLNVCDLSTDGCFTLGAAVGAVVAIAGHMAGDGHHGAHRGPQREAAVGAQIAHVQHGVAQKQGQHGQRAGQSQLQRRLYQAPYGG